MTRPSPGKSEIYRVLLAAHVVRVSRVTLRVLAEAIGQLVALSTLPLSTTSISAIAPRSIALFAIRISKTSAQLL